MKRRTPFSKVRSRLVQERKAPANHREELNAENLGGAILGCNYSTREESLATLTFCLPLKYLSTVEKVRAGKPIFLYDFSAKQLHGVYAAVQEGDRMLHPEASIHSYSMSAFPSQVKVEVVRKCAPLDLAACRSILRVGIPKANMFYFDLDEGQVAALRKLFEDNEK